MVLRFNPPPLPPEEETDLDKLNRVAAIINQYALQQKEERAQKLDRAIKVAGLGKDIATSQAELGPEQTNAIYGGIRSQFPELQQDNMVHRWNANGKDDETLMQEFQADPLAFQSKYGTKRADKLRMALQTTQTLEANRPVTPGQYSALQSGESKAISEAYPNGIPRQLAGSALSAQSRNVRVTTDPYGNPIRVPVAGGPATSIEVPGQNFSPLQRKLNPIEYKDWQKEVNDFDNDAVVKQERVGLATLNNIEREIANYNPALTGPLASQQARAIAREVGTLNEGDVRRQVPDPSLFGRFKKAVSIAATGELPKDQLELIRQVVNVIKQGSNSRLQSVARERATRKSNQYGNKISPDELMQSLNLPTQFSVGNQAGMLSPEKKARLEELRRKKAEGTLR